MQKTGNLNNFELIDQIKEKALEKSISFVLDKVKIKHRVELELSKNRDLETSQELLTRSEFKDLIITDQRKDLEEEFKLQTVPEE